MIMFLRTPEPKRHPYFAQGIIHDRTCDIIIEDKRITYGVDTSDAHLNYLQYWHRQQEIRKITYAVVSVSVTETVL